MQFFKVKWQRERERECAQNEFCQESDRGKWEWSWRVRVIAQIPLVWLSTVKSHTTLKGKFSFGHAHNWGCQSLLYTQLASLQPQRATLPRFARELPFSVAGWPTSCSIEALYTSIGGTPGENLPLSVVRLYYRLGFVLDHKIVSWESKVWTCGFAPTQVETLPFY